MKNILGFDIGTNSIGWALINYDFDVQQGEIVDVGSRIIPTDTTLLGAFETGQSASKNENRRMARGARRLRQRYKLRRSRLVDVMKLLGWLPHSYVVGNGIPVSNERLEQLRIYFGVSGEEGTDIPHDWLVYFLKERGLMEMLAPAELARVLYHFNQRRGFKSNRKTDAVNPMEDEADIPNRTREKTVERVSIKDVVEGDRQKGKTIYNVLLSDGREGTILRATRPDWIGQELELEITRIVNKAKETRYEFRQLANNDKDKWAKQKLARELAIANFKRDVMPKGHVSSYYLYELKKDPTFIIKDVPIDRAHYENEIRAILHKQVELYEKAGNPLMTTDTLSKIATELYPGENPTRRDELQKKDLVYILLDDIIYYQRPLRSQKGSIAVCRYAKKNFRYRDDKGLTHQAYFKSAPISSPIFQEFRIWQTINNLRIVEREYRDPKGRLKTDRDISHDAFTTEAKEKLFDLFNGKEKVNQKQILDTVSKATGKKYPVDQYLVSNFRSREDSEMPGNETKVVITRALKRVELDDKTIDAILADKDKYDRLWHILYSLEDPKHVSKALVTQVGIDTDKAEKLSRTKAFKSGYGSLSSKAMKQLLPLMKCGKYWKWEAIDKASRSRLEKIFTGEFDEGISDHVRELFSASNISDKNACQGFAVSMAAYSVFGIHSEKERGVYDRPEDIQRMKPFELRNPIVEQVVNETLMIVRDVWKKHGVRPFQIHLELSRDLKKNAKEREAISKRISEDEKTNRRIAAILNELRLGNPQSISDIERMKLTERQSVEQAEQKSKDKYFEAIKFKKPAEPTKAEIEKYKLWASQNFRSPYSGKTISLSGLFNKREYDIDHIIPKSRWFDDSLDNKVVVETSLNKEKGQMTAMEYMLSNKNLTGKRMRTKDYEDYVSRYFSGKKKRLLLSEDVPDSMINRQQSDTRYIGKKLNELLAGIPEYQTKPIVQTNGSITSELRHKWGLDDMFKQLLLERYERLERNMNPALERGEDGFENYWDYEDQLGNDNKPTGKKILKLKDWSKRIDHRHHALDAITIACTTDTHIKYLNDLNAAHYRPRKDEDGNIVTYRKLLIEKEGDDAANRKFRLPWTGFTDSAKDALSSIVISYKPSLKNDRFLVGRIRNRITKFVKENGTWKKKTVKAEGNHAEAFSSYVRVPLGAGANYGTIGIKQYDKNVSIKKALQNPELIAKPAIREKIVQILKQYSDNHKQAEQFLLEYPLTDHHGNPMSIDLLQKTIRTVDIHEALRNVSFITDTTIKKQMQRALSVSSGNRKDAAAYLSENPFLNSAGEPVSEVEISLPYKTPLSANRVDIDTKCNHQWIENNVVSGSVKKALIMHLNTYSRIDENGKELKGAEVAFDAEGIETLNRNRKVPIRKVRVKEAIGKKYMLGDLLVQAAKGSNLFFVVYVNNETGKHLITENSSVPLHQVVEARKANSSFVEEKEGYSWFTLSPGDLVYVPEPDEEVKTTDWIKDKNRISSRIYMVKSFTKGECHFAPQHVAKAIVPSDRKNKGEIGWYDKSEYSVDGIAIKSVCIKLNHDRLGNVKPA
ncbi:MAG: hypothetical protein K9J17_14680 [Flavobacteriales bacterium]|nr:hypothetical protein [Flavobacteriales bacterium]